MDVRLDLRYLIFFAALSLLLVEAHEQCHAIVTRLACGGWAPRVFDNVLPYAGCSPQRLAVVDAAGPLFSLAVLWIGTWMTRRASGHGQGLGLSLAFASLPLARLLPQVVATFVAGSTSDEYGLLRRLSGDALDRAAAGGLATLAALALVVPPLVVLWRQLPAGRRGRLMAGFLCLPLVFVIFWTGVVNGALAQGVMKAPLLPGWPLLLALQALAAAVVAVALRRAPAGLTGPAAPARPSRARPPCE